MWSPGRIAGLYGTLRAGSDCGKEDAESGKWVTRTTEWIGRCLDTGKGVSEPS